MTNISVTTSFWLVIARFFWLQLGPMILIVVVLNILLQGSGWLTALDLLFLITLVGLILSRFGEFYGGHPLTSTGEPATRTHLRRYIVGVLLIGVSTWVVANVVGNHLIPR